MPESPEQTHAPRPNRSPAHETLLSLAELKMTMQFQLESLRELRKVVEESNKATMRLFRMTVAALILLAGAEKVVGYFG